MEARDTEQVPLEDQDAQLERKFQEEYLNQRGYTVSSLRQLPEGLAKCIRREASTYASLKLAEIRDKADFVHKLHGAP